MDIHTETAKKIFGTNNITPEMRLAAKRKNFLDIYGRHNVSMKDVLESKELDKKVWNRKQNCNNVWKSLRNKGFGRLWICFGCTPFGNVRKV